MIRFLFLFFIALPVSAQSWHKVGTVKGVVGNYTPVIVMGGSQIRVYANTNGSVDGNLYLRGGSWSKVGSAAMVFDNLDPRDTFIRTSGIARGASGTYYAVLYTGDGYPTQGGYSPSWATSPDGYAWTWHGPISPFGRNQSSAAALVVDESHSDAYRFMFWMDIPSGLMLVHSADGETWESDGVNMWPIAEEVPQFVTAVRTPSAYHLMGCKSFPCGQMRHLVSCDGINDWRVVEMASRVINNQVGKGTNLAWDGTTLHALSSGVHWTSPEQDWGC